jgi:hypothetical protein
MLWQETEQTLVIFFNYFTLTRIIFFLYLKGGFLVKNGYVRNY